MGMYTSMRCIVELKDKWVPAFNDILSEYQSGTLSENTRPTGLSLIGYKYHLGPLIIFSKIDTKISRMFGDFGCLHGHWKSIDPWNLSKPCELNGNLLTMQTNSKNHGGGTSNFRWIVLTEAITRCDYFADWYEEWPEPREWDFNTETKTWAEKPSKWEMNQYGEWEFITRKK